jgi:hypothetical protein
MGLVQLLPRLSAYLVVHAWRAKQQRLRDLHMQTSLTVCAGAADAVMSLTSAYSATAAAAPAPAV